MSVEIKKGLEGVYIDESRISSVDGENGIIWYSGYNIDDLVTETTFEEVLHLLWNQHLPDRDELQELTEDLQSSRELPEPVARILERSAQRARPMDLLRTAVSALSFSDPDPANLDDLPRKLIRIVSTMPTILAAAYRIKRGEQPVPPRKDLSHAGNFLYMMRGEQADPDEVRAMDATLILYAEHGMNASTFSSVVTTSTLASPYSSITSAIGTLEGPLHGGAMETVIDMIEGIGSAERAEQWVKEKLENKERIPGFGHRVYRVTDPRCAHFKREIDSLKTEQEEDWVRTIETVRETVENHLGDKGIWPNTDLYSGTMLRMLGIPPDFYIGIFALARVAGWSAHVFEQLEENRILRPRVRYVGETGRRVVPIDHR